MNIDQVITIVELNKKSSKNTWEYKAVLNWLKQAKRNSYNKDSNFGKSMCCVEAIYHLSQVQEYEISLHILKVESEISTNYILSMPFYEYLLYHGEGQKVLKIVKVLLEGINSNSNEMFFLRMLKAKASESLGQRALAVQIYQDIYKNEPYQSNHYIEALARFASCQIQMGQYQSGVKILENTLKIIAHVDQDNSNIFLNDIKHNLIEEMAFYKMNIGSFNEAYALFGLVIKHRQLSDNIIKIVSPLGHQGIILRKSAIPKLQLLKILLVNTFRLLGLNSFANFLYTKLCKPSRFDVEQNYKKAEDLLQQASDVCDKTDGENAKAWIAHHLSWVLINDRKSYLAKVQANIAINQYEINGDERGMSDCHEQLGRIYLTNDNMNLQKAEFHLNQSLRMRLSISNPHGVASSILSLSFLYWHKKEYLKACHFLIKSAEAHRKINMLSAVRIFALLTLFSVWTVGDRDWTA
jgi:tetratricopeptide (TPR) repeat protein